ncbi:DNA-directed RNA polymerase III subunit C1 (rpo31) [Microbotryomycetes sp. JL221]|nr:DNA-directed RNA polymerase III subunit C1 (rpo31) [Microbotryomycetes sp. JL221]
MKQLAVDAAPKRIKHIQFSVLNPREIVTISEFDANQRDLYKIEDRSPVQHGVLDRRLGTSDKSGRCETCGLPLAECVGHYAYIKLVLPVFHIGYFRHCLSILQCICKTCSRILLPPADCRKYLALFRRPNLDSLTVAALSRTIAATARKCAVCHYCSGINGVVKKTGPMRIGHEKFRGRNSKIVGDEEGGVDARGTYQGWRDSFAEAIAETKELEAHIDKAVEDLNPLKVLSLFKNIPDVDCELLGLDPTVGRPEDFVWQYLSVPPVCIRPSVQQEAATNEDDITVKLTEIIFMNAVIKTGLAKGVTTQNLMEQWDFLQLAVATYINSELPGIPTVIGQKPIRGFCQRLKGKQGRFRGNLSGKRVDFSGRTVISPDPNLQIDQVAVPERVAKNLTYPERVTSHNIDRLRDAVRNGTEVHPGANFILQQGQENFKKFLKFGDRNFMADKLRIGDVVERHLRDDDIVLFNRQPSLHRLSIMSHRVKVRPWRTFRLNECVCTPYNADFDGDEMNLHVPQTEESRTEAFQLMNVKRNLVTPRNGEPIIAATQDFITGCFLITRRDTFFNRQEFTQICSYFADANLHIDLPPPTIVKPVRLWTGKQVFSCLMRPNKDSPIRINLEAKNKTMEKVTIPGAPMDMSPNDGYLVIQNSEIMCGVFDKATVGDGNKNSVFAVMQRDYGEDVAAEGMNRMAKVCARWLANKGFSIGISDVTPGEKLSQLKDELVETAYAESHDYIRQAATGKLELQPGSDVDGTLEAVISGALSRVRDKAGEICMNELSRNNAPLIMATCGSKGSKINVCQMVACVGQQIIAGKRVPNGFQDRSLPHFPKGAKDPPAKGFVRNSFYTGLVATEFLFHAISGREGLVDTAVKTAETGYMARRLMKALEDLSARYDRSVRSANGGVVQFVYGDDGLDPVQLEGDGKPVAYERTWAHARADKLKATEQERRAGKDVALLPFEMPQLAREVMETKPLTSKAWKACSQEFKDEVIDFIIKKIAEPAAKVRGDYGLPAALEPLAKGAPRDGKVSREARNVVNNLTKISVGQLERFLELCCKKYIRAKVEPGTAVGAIGAQSIGEPGTQMTLKTFHFAGVASMNVTLGVPRIKEIINAAKSISTPIITAKLAREDDERAARIVKARIEKTFLGDIASVVAANYDSRSQYVSVHIDMNAIYKLQLEVTLDSIKESIVAAPKLKIKSADVTVDVANNRLLVFAGPVPASEVYHRLLWLRRVLPEVAVKGVQGLHRAVIQKEIVDGKNVNKLLVEGEGLREVMTTDGVIGKDTKSNHIMEVEKILGIEAARNTIIEQIHYTMSSHGLGVDPRHLMLLGDVMCFKGEVLGITRFGVAKMKDSVLMLASFEKTTDHLFNAAFNARRDPIQGVSECIILGSPANNVGSAMPALVSAKPVLPPRVKLLFERDQNVSEVPVTIKRRQAIKSTAAVASATTNGIVDVDMKDSTQQSPGKTRGGRTTRRSTRA